MSVNGVQIEVGQVWKTRCGERVRVDSRSTSDVYPYIVRAVGEPCFPYTVNERGWQMHSTEGADDLVEILYTPSTPTERRKRSDPNSPLRRADDFPPVPAGLPDLNATPEDFAASMPGALDEAPMRHPGPIEMLGEEDPVHGAALNVLGAKADKGKVRAALVLGDFARALLEVSKVGTFGAVKYTDHGWLHVKNGIDRYDDAKLRHWLQEKTGEFADPQTGIAHAAHEVWNGLARLELLLRKNEMENNNA